MSCIRKYLSADGLLSIVKHGLWREKFKAIKNPEYTWEDCIMSGLAVFGFKMPSLLQFEKDKAAEPFIRRNLRTLYGVDKASSDTCMRERLDEVVPQQLRRPFKQIFSDLILCNGLTEKEVNIIIDAGEWALLNIANHPTLSLIVGSELEQTIKREINLAAEQNRPLKYLLFVAHDSTIAAQLKLLGQTIDEPLSYASQINYSLFDMGSSNYEVRVSYNQKPLHIEQCGGESCTLNEFTQLINDQFNSEKRQVMIQ